MHASASYLLNNVQGGLIIEQATHFCDLCRYFGGEVDDSTLNAIAIRATDVGGQLERIPANVEVDLPPERRISRVTSAFWKFTSGAIGSLNHGALLHGVRYESEFEVWGDGLRLLLRDPYDKCILEYRLPGSEVNVEETFDDDPYYNEDEAFLKALLEKKCDFIQSSYADAFKTYELTWKIRLKSEEVL